MARAAPRQPGPPAGVIFGCNRSSEEESLNGLFGMSSGHWSLVKEIIPGTPCFLFNFNTKELHGVFRAVSAGSWNIDPLAFGGKPKEGSMYPAQVRVEYCPRCPPMEEQYFKPAIASNYFNPNRFRWELNERQVEELLDLFLGVGAPWPPENRQARVEAPAFVEDTSSRAYTVEAVPPHARLEAHSPYTARSRYASRSPVRDRYRRHADEDRRRCAPEVELPRNLQSSFRRDEYRRSHSPRPRYTDRPSVLPEELRLPPARSDGMALPRPLAVHDAYRSDLRHGTPAAFSMYGDSMNMHHAAEVALRDPSLAVSPIAVHRLSPPRQQLLLQAPGHRQQEAGPPPAYDLSLSGHVGDMFTGLACDTAILDRQPASLSALPADLTLSERFQQLPETREQRHAAKITTEPLQITTTAGAGRAVTFKQPEPVIARPSSAPAPGVPVSGPPTTLVISSIPHGCTTTILVSILDHRHRDQYDFVHYQPSEEFDSTAVVNFIQPRYAHEFQDEIQDALWSDLYEFDPPTSAIASVGPHSVQGKEALMAHHGTAATRFGGAPSNESRLPSNRPLFFFCARKRPASAEHEQAPAPLRLRMPTTSSHLAMHPPSLQAGTRAEFGTEDRGFGAAVNGTEPDRNSSLPPSPLGRPARPASPSNVSEHDRAQVRSRPGSAAATSSRAPHGLEPLKITIKQEPGLAHPITPSPESALDGMGHTLSLLESRGVSSSPGRAGQGQPVSQQEAAAFLQNLGPELQQLQRRPKPPSHRHRSPSRHSHRHQSSSRQHGSKSSRPCHADKVSDRQDKHTSRRSSHAEHKSSRGVQKVSAREAKPPRDRSNKDRDSKHRKPADVKVSTRNRPLQPADQPAAEQAAPKFVRVSVNAAPFHAQPSNGDMSTAAANSAANDAQPARQQTASSSRPYEEAVADNIPGSAGLPDLQHSQEAVTAEVATADREQGQHGKYVSSRASAGMRPSEFGGDFLPLSTNSP
ncbi:hypothetical protein ABBQ32_012446 [Trebouxia sp. C0010 RCD-2024]